MNLPNELQAHLLYGKKIILGITGGIAIVKTCELARSLTRAGAEVHPVLTQTATKMISAEVFSALTAQKSWVDQWQEDRAGMMAHLALSRDADAIIVAPATANTLAKFANGIADDLLSTLVLGRQSNCPLLLAPAMNVAMWDNPATQKNINTLVKQGAIIFAPEAGLLACGEEGIGRLMSVEALMWHITRRLIVAEGKAKLLGKNVLVTLGPTLEKIDPVRGITNISSGSMGLAMAQAAWLMGANVQVVAGGQIPSFLADEPTLMWQAVQSASEMYDAVHAQINTHQVELFLAVAAVADYRAAATHTQKIKKHDDEINITLTKNPDILKSVAVLSKRRPSTVLGFAAESEKIIEFAKQKLIDKKLDYIVANDVANAFGNTHNSGFLLSANSPERVMPLPMQAKALMAWQIISELLSKNAK